MSRAEEYWCMNDRLPPKGMCSVSCDLFRLWEISDNISETAQDRDMLRWVAGMRYSS